MELNCREDIELMVQESGDLHAETDEELNAVSSKTWLVALELEQFAIAGVSLSFLYNMDTSNTAGKKIDKQEESFVVKIAKRFEKAGELLVGRILEELEKAENDVDVRTLFRITGLISEED